MENARARLSATRRKAPRVGAHSKADNFIIKTGRQVALCVFFALVLTGISRINHPLAKDFTQSIQSTLRHTIDYRQTAVGLWGWVKGIPDLWKTPAPIEDTDTIPESVPDAAAEPAPTAEEQSQAPENAQDTGSDENVFAD